MGFAKKPYRPVREAKEYEEEVIEIRRVTRVVKGGRRLRFRATVVIGNRKGKVGVGTGKSVEVTGAIQKAISQAKKNLVTIVLNEGTIPHEIKIKYKSAKLLLFPAGPGTGIIAGGTARKVLGLAGVKNILSKTIGSSNKLLNTYATYEALKELERTPAMLLKKAKQDAKIKPQIKAEEKKKEVPTTKEVPKKNEEKPKPKPNTDKK